MKSNWTFLLLACYCYLFSSSFVIKYLPSIDVAGHLTKSEATWSECGLKSVNTSEPTEMKSDDSHDFLVFAQKFQSGDGSGMKDVSNEVCSCSGGSSCSSSTYDNRLIGAVSDDVKSYLASNKETKSEVAKLQDFADWVAPPSFEGPKFAKYIRKRNQAGEKATMKSQRSPNKIDCNSLMKSYQSMAEINVAIKRRLFHESRPQLQAEVIKPIPPFPHSIDAICPPPDPFILMKFINMKSMPKTPRDGQRRYNPEWIESQVRYYQSCSDRHSQNVQTYYLWTQYQKNQRIQNLLQRIANDEREQARVLGMMAQIQHQYDTCLNSY